MSAFSNIFLISLLVSVTGVTLEWHWGPGSLSGLGPWIAVLGLVPLALCVGVWLRDGGK